LSTLEKTAKNLIVWITKHGQFNLPLRFVQTTYPGNSEVNIPLIIHALVCLQKSS